MNNDGTCRYYDFDNFNSEVVKNRNDLSIFHLNICSLLGKWDELLNFLNMLSVSFEIICITETWIREDSPLETVTIPGYAPFHAHRDGRGGGICVFVKSHLYTRKLQQFCTVNDNLECLLVESRVGDRVIVVCCVYRPPQGNIEIFLRTMDQIL